MDILKYAGSLNFNKICRTCLTENDDMELIFNDNTSNEFTFSYQAMLMSCTKLQITHGDGLPSNICLQCIAEVSQAFTFKTQSERAENILRKYLLDSNLNNEGPNENHESFETKETFSNKENNEAEENVAHESNNIFQEDFTARKLLCGFCPKRFKNRYELQRHQNIHLGVKFSCATCSRQFSQESSRNYHVRTVHERDHKPLQSMISKEQEEQEIKRKQQNDFAKVCYRIHFGGVTNDPKKCNFCSKRFRTKYELIRHMNIHLGVKFKCLRCDKRFTQAAGRNSHMKKAHGISVRKKRFSTEKLCPDGNVNTTKKNPTESESNIIKPEDIKKEANDEYVIMTHIKEENYEPEFLLPLSDSDQFESIEYLKDDVWVCDICTEGFQHKEILMAHLETHMTGNSIVINMNNTEYKCPKCSKSYQGQLSLNAHMRVHKNEETSKFVCNFCKQTFRRQIDLNAHSGLHANVEPKEEIEGQIIDFDEDLPESATFKCNLCPKLFKTTNALRGHVKVHKEHNHGTVFTCSRCNIGFPTQGLFIKHDMLFHNEQDPVSENDSKIIIEEYMVLNSDNQKFADDKTCTDYQFLDDPGVNNSMTDFTLLEEPEVLENDAFIMEMTEDPSDTVDNLIMADIDTFQCDICLLCFETTDILLRHKIDVHLSETSSNSAITFTEETKKCKTYDGSDKKFTCGVCGRGFTKHVYMKRHMMLHTGEKPYKCTETGCSAAFSNSGMLVSHKRKKHKTSSNTFLCSRCGDTFISNDRLREHTKRHLNQRDFPCLYCEKKFFTKNTLRIHTRIHTNEKPYMCQFCGKGFAQMGDMQLHVRWHTGEKPYKCNYCDRRFTTTGNRRDHEVIHLDERNFKCSVCSKAFKAQRTLKMHFRQHTGERPYTCEVCNKSFRRQHHVRIHMKVHGINILPKPKNF